MSPPVSRGFRRLRRPWAGEDGRVPPGQYVTEGFPVLVPHLYFWKSYGYHIYGDPWKEQRYAGD